MKLKKLEKCETLDSKDEFEFMFNNYNDNPLRMTSFLDMLKYLSIKSKNENLQLENTNMLDIIYNYDEKTNNTYDFLLMVLIK